MAMRAAGSIAAEFQAVTDTWSPRVVAEANGQFVKIARVDGELVWHAHAGEDEFFLCQEGTFGLRFRDGSEVCLNPGEFTVVPRGVEHLPFTVGGPAKILFVEPAGTLHTGDVVGDRTRSIAAQTSHLTT
jgi:mannose-6-phosphate isomerase-like protein (cupin superfamily)